MTTDLTALDLLAAAAGLARRGFTARELTEAYLRRIEAVNPRLNAYLHVTAGLALAQADASDRRKDRLGPLDGIPLALKDNIDLEGVVTTNGMGPRGAVPAAKDAAVVARLRAAGAVVLGKLNMDEGALGATTDNPHHGRTHNPWRHGFTPGGSSGGAGAAVAARLSVATLGTDTMGSVRLPAAYCGVVGLKPSHGLIDTRGVVPLCHRLDHVGPIARSARDLLPLLSAMARPADLTQDDTDVALAGLRFGRLANFDRVELTADVRDGFERSLRLLGELGARVETLSIPSYDSAAARRAGLLICEAEAAAALEQDLKRHPGAFSPPFRAMLEYGRDAPAARRIEAERVVQQAGDCLRRVLERTDVVIAPTAPQPAFSFDQPAPANQADLTALANVAGCPAISLPGGTSSLGLPLAVQLIAPPGRDHRLLALAAAFEAAIGYRLPDLL